MANDAHESRKAAVYEAALQLIGQGVSPAALKIQQLADAAGIGKGTVYEYFSSKDEILRGLAVYCFCRENARIRALMADCTTLAGLEDRVLDYLRDIASERMGSYKMIAETLGAPDCHGGLKDCTEELEQILGQLLERLRAAGEIDPALNTKYCCLSLLSVVVGGLMGLYYAHENERPVDGLLENLRVMLDRTLRNSAREG